MAINKNAVIRYNTLDKCFSNFGRKHYFDDLLEDVNNALTAFDSSSAGIQVRQLRDDIRFMKSESGYAAPIAAIRDGRKAYYRYEDKNFSINKKPINQSEAELLKTALTVLQRFKGIPQFEWINELSPVLTNQFGLNNDTQKVISYDTNIDYSGYDKIQPIYNAIVNRRVLEIEYAPFEKSRYKLKFHPYYLKQYNNRWFTFGLNQKLKIPEWNLALDRIIDLKEVNDDYQETQIDWEEYFYDIIGVTTPRDKKPEKVEVLFTKQQANYVRTKPLHPTQKAKLQKDGKLLVTLTLIPNYELEMTLLSYGENVAVISPNYLCNKLKIRLKDALKIYE